METPPLANTAEVVPRNGSPHSLGKPIEWKHTTRLLRVAPVVTLGSSPHSLGKPIEWKLADFSALFNCLSLPPPHSLGKPIEWKLSKAGDRVSPIFCAAPHSLGKPIEWKPWPSQPECSEQAQPKLPTRWGNQLNGNL